MSFLDEVREALRRPPGLPDAESDVPDALFEQCRRIVYRTLGALPEGPVLAAQHERWGNSGELRRRLAAAWRAVCEGLLAGASDHERIVAIEDAVRQSLGATGPRAGGVVGREAKRVAGLLGVPAASLPWLDAPRYLVEIGALDSSGTRRTRLGDLVVRLGVREQVVALLHAEATQSSGITDDFRIPRWALVALAQQHPLEDERDPEPWPNLARLIAWGLLGQDYNSQLYYVTDRLPWLREAANDQSPLAILVRSTLEDQAQAAIGTSLPSSQRSVHEMAELVAHELGNALSPLDLTVGQLARELGTEDRHVARLRAITTRLQQFATLIDRLLPAGEPTTPIGLLDVLQDALAQTASERNGHLTVSVAVTDTVFQGRRSRLLLAFENVVRNAAQAAQSGSGSAQLWIRSQRTTSALVIVFEDDGPGVPTELLEVLFDRGISGRGTSGLGLALVREVAAEHHGQVRHEPREGGGARFVLTLPVE